MTVSLHAFHDDRAPAMRLASELTLPAQKIGLHVMPDGESLPTVRKVGETALLYRSLDRPDGKLMPLLLAADALRRAGAERVVLVAPYMPYLRQDRVFAPGQPLSRDVIGEVLGRAFDRIVTVEPHLHRTADLAPVFADTTVSCLTSAPLLAAYITAAGDPVIVGPDAESRPWTEAIALRLGASAVVQTKIRRGDRRVAVSGFAPADVAGRRTVLVDDICSSGATLLAAASGLRAAGAASIEVVVVHNLSNPDVGASLRRAGVRAFAATDSCNRRKGAIHLAPLLAAALTPEFDRCP
jgi:ribose-phosphate pyrophosphokinase